MCSGKRTDDPLYQNVMGDDRPLFNQYLSQVRFDSKTIPATRAHTVLTKANLLFQTKVVDSNPSTSLCPIPVGAGGVKIFLSGNSGAVVIFPRHVGICGSVIVVHPQLIRTVEVMLLVPCLEKGSSVATQRLRLTNRRSKCIESFQCWFPC